MVTRDTLEHKNNTNVINQKVDLCRLLDEYCIQVLIFDSVEDNFWVNIFKADPAWVINYQDQDIVSFTRSDIIQFTK